MKKAYYAHCMAIYGTPQEARDIELLQGLGFEVVNPSSKEVEAVMATLATSDERMAYFEKFADECDICVFRGLPDTSVPSGVAKELGWFKARSKPVLELPGFAGRKMLSYEDTKQYLHEVGQR